MHCSKADEDKLENMQNRAGRRILGLTWRFPSVVVRGEIGWRKLKFERHSMALQYLGRLSIWVGLGGWGLRGAQELLGKH